jgi:proteic killer suppression protein
MIRNIRHKGLDALYQKDETKGVRQDHVKRLRQILALLDSAITLEDMDAPGLRLHGLKGNRKGLYAVTVSGNWRVIFRFEGGDALDVDYIDYQYEVYYANEKPATPWRNHPRLISCATQADGNASNRGARRYTQNLSIDSKWSRGYFARNGNSARKSLWPQSRKLAATTNAI